jgi:hypothetical protein
MDGSFYILRNRSMPWGDYGDILLSGMTGHLDRENGLLQLERTGPFVPPITITGFDANGYEHIVVTDAFKSSLETASLSGLRFLPVVKRRIVRLDWQTWDQTAEKPGEYPQSYEPEDYILLRRHDQEIADQMGRLWEVCLEEHARTERRQTGQGPWGEDIYLLRASWDGTDWFRAAGVGYTYVSETARLWLEHTLGQWVMLEAARVR